MLKYCLTLLQRQDVAFVCTSVGRGGYGMATLHCMRELHAMEGLHVTASLHGNDGLHG